MLLCGSFTQSIFFSYASYRFGFGANLLIRALFRTLYFLPKTILLIRFFSLVPSYPGTFLKLFTWFRGTLTLDVPRLQRNMPTLSCPVRLNTPKTIRPTKLTHKYLFISLSFFRLVWLFNTNRNYVFFSLPRTYSFRFFFWTIFWYK